MVVIDSGHPSEAIARLRARVNAQRELPPIEARRALRLSANISLRALANAVGCSHQSILNWESGGTPHPRYLASYVEALQVLKGS